MTQQDYQIASKRANLYANVFGLLVLILVTVPFVVAIDVCGPWLQAEGAWMKAHIPNEALGGAIAGIAISAVIVPSFFGPAIATLVWAHRRFGVRCPKCGSSLTLWKNCRSIGQTGKCCWCQEQLFNPADDGWPKA
jgi:hypothetical protein